MMSEWKREESTCDWVNNTADFEIINTGRVRESSSTALQVRIKHNYKL